MRVLVLGAAGLQGQVAVCDLLASPAVETVTAADVRPEGLEALRGLPGSSKLRTQTMDATGVGELGRALGAGFDVAVDLLPSRLMGQVAAAAVAGGCHLVNTMYGHQLPAGIGAAAARAGVTIMPESGLDPGIDLVLCALGTAGFDEVHELHAYCGGLPEAEAAGNPLRYKISWSWEGVLKSYARPAVVMREGAVVAIPAADQHAAQWVGELDFAGLGRLESIPNGDAMVFARHLGIAGQVRNTTRCTLRWPGHSALWKAFTDLGFLEEAPVPGLAGGVSPREFMLRHLEPRLQYGRAERDVIVMRVVVAGLKGGQPACVTYDLIDRRDLATGFLAMQRTVGFTASIVAQMVGAGEISKRGLLTAVKDIPARVFLDRLARRGIGISEVWE